MIGNSRQLMLSVLLAAGVSAPAALAQTTPAPAAPPEAAAPAAAPTTPPVAAAPAAAPTTPDTAATAPEAEITAADAQAGKIGAPPAGKALIVFFRPSALGAALGFTIHDGDTLVSKIGNGSYQVAIVEPGTHEYTITSEVTDRLRLEIDPKETYYVKQTMSMGFFVGHPHLVLSDKETFDKVKASMRVSKWTAPATTADKAAAPAEQGVK